MRLEAAGATSRVSDEDHIARASFAIFWLPTLAQNRWGSGIAGPGQQPASVDQRSRYTFECRWPCEIGRIGHVAMLVVTLLLRAPFMPLWSGAGHEGFLSVGLSIALLVRTSVVVRVFCRGCTEFHHSITEGKASSGLGEDA